MIKTFFIINEAYPLYKIGGLGDVGGSLPKALSQIDIDISIVLPQHPEIKTDQSWQKLSEFPIQYKQKELIITIYKGLLPNSKITTYLVSESNYISKHTDASDNHADKYAVFSLAISQWISYLDASQKPEIIHLNDWHTSLIPIISNHLFNNQNVKFLTTIHNLMYQGNTNTPIIENLNLPKDACQLLSVDSMDNHINILLEGLLHSHKINTVSPNYAKEILTHEYGEQINEILSLRKKDIVGILNGLDLNTFNPSLDSHLKFNYSLQNVTEGKLKNKQQLQIELELEQDTSKTLVGFVGRVDPDQKGIQLIIEAIKNNYLISENEQFVFLGTGEVGLEKQLHQVSENKLNIKIFTRYDESLASKIYAASDLLLIPSKFEPCGLIQMIAMKYGAIPVARNTGGLRDTIDHQQNGFLFDKYTVEDMVTALGKAIQIISDESTKSHMIQSAMGKDFSWDKSAQEYKQLYQDIIKE